MPPTCKAIAPIRAVIDGDRQRDERDSAVGQLKAAIQQWRPVLFVWVPAAASNIRTIPAGGGTVDDLVQIADDMVQVFNEQPELNDIPETAVAELTAAARTARKENSEAVTALPVEADALEAHTDACLEANTVLVHGTRTVRSAFGPTSPEYRQFISRGSSADEEEIDSDSDLGEQVQEAAKVTAQCVATPLPHQGRPEAGAQYPGFPHFVHYQRITCNADRTTASPTPVRHAGPAPTKACTAYLVACMGP